MGYKYVLYNDKCLLYTCSMKAIGELMGDVPAPPNFNMWWAVYPRKQGDKTKCEKKYNELSDADKGACYLGTLEHAEKNTQWQDKQYIPLPATFLNQKRWNDEIIRTKSEDIKENALSSGELIDMVWLVMTEMYGERWIKEFGKTPPELWRKLLKPIPDHRIRRGLRATLERCQEHPPSLPQFVKFCAKTFGEEHPRALPKPPGDPDKALEAFAEMKKILGVT